MGHLFDVLVAGGGPAGSAAALDLSHRGFSVALIEQDKYETPRIGETLPPMIRHQLTGLGIWERFLECGPLESYGIQTAWETPTPRHQDFLHNPYGCGWHVDRTCFDAMLASAAAEAGAELVVSARVSSCHWGADGHWMLEAVQAGRVLTFSGRMLVDATGRRALLAGRGGSQAHVADRLIGAVTFSESSEAARWTLIEAVEDGWWYSAPLPGARMVFAYMTDSDLWGDPARGNLLNLAPLTFERAGRKGVPPPSQIVSAASVVRHPVTGPNWMAIGDAALAFDPLSGQGVFKSIETGTRASSTIARYFDGDFGAPAEYEGWVHETYQSYLSTRSQLYRSVQRWPGSRFWNRRAAV
ncbi:MAG TPA: tryptophan 7-halogenase [Bryobacteraceae bacterium]|nr:tryptophan 7-halogenase [Bryobacteraceae bacterium]